MSLKRALENNDSVQINRNLNEIAQDMADFMDKELKVTICNSFEPQKKCLNPDCKGFFAHSQVGLIGGDYPQGYDGRYDD